MLVDVTAEDTAPLLLRALNSGMDVVLANRRPLTASRPVAEALRAAAAGGRRLLHETTVGAGLPIIDTYLKLAEAGDRVLTEIAGNSQKTMHLDHNSGSYFTFPTADEMKEFRRRGFRAI